VLTGSYDGTAKLWWADSLPGDANEDCKVNLLDLLFIRDRIRMDVSSLSLRFSLFDRHFHAATALASKT